MTTTKTKTKTTWKTERETADMFAALSVAAERGAKRDWPGASVQLEIAEQLAPTKQLRLAIRILTKHLKVNT